MDNFQTLIETHELYQRLTHPDMVVVDCSFWLNEPELGHQNYLKQHIPGAVYAHLDEHLSGKMIPGKTSRHPFPSIEKASKVFSSWGIDERVQVVAYDDRGGAIAARLWMLLRWLGHKHVAVLNGGLAKWQAEGLPLTAEIKTVAPRAFMARPRPELLKNAEDLLGAENTLLVDSRGPARYRGEEEPYDDVSGHIATAVNSYYDDVFTEAGTFKDQKTLKAHFAALTQNHTDAEVVFYCGSGVTANVNLLAMQHAGLGEGRLYPGSWSEWITDKNRPIETGDK